MNIENKYPVMIFKKEYQGNTFYNVGLSRKDRDGKYINGYMPCRFKNNVSVEDKTKMYIKNAWLDFYLKDKETKPYIFINEFELVGETIKKSKVQEQQETLNEVINDPFAEFGNEVEINPEDLPF